MNMFGRERASSPVGWCILWDGVFCGMVYSVGWCILWQNSLVESSPVLIMMTEIMNRRAYKVGTKLVDPGVLRGKEE